MSSKRKAASSGVPGTAVALRSESSAITGDLLVYVGQRARLMYRDANHVGRLVPALTVDEIARRLRQNVRKIPSGAALPGATGEWVRALLWRCWPELAVVRGEPRLGR